MFCRLYLPLLTLAFAAAGLLAGCGDAGPAASASGKLRVVAAENTWGDIAAQLGGDRVEVTDVVSSPAADPHDYEPTSEDARTMAAAQLAIVNGLGYDAWASKLLEANPSEERAVIDVGDVLDLEDGENPHQWYSPSAVRAVIASIAAAYAKAEPEDGAYFDRQRRRFERVGLREYDRLIEQIRSRYAGTPVGASESIFAPLGPALGLRLSTPVGFLDAVSEGTEPTPSEKVAVDRQIDERRIAVWVYNSQNATPDVQRLNDAAAGAGIPVVTVTETPTPEGTSFQAWQVRQLRGLERALAEAGGR
ncbi:MAG: zinc ABC transporter substrate-binding protein [Solirubrobacterales bacterium]